MIQIKSENPVNFSNIKLLVLDCDGVLTDGSVTYTAEKDSEEWVIRETKQFSVSDGLILDVLRYSDLKVVVITGRSSKALEERCKDLNIYRLYQGVRNKLSVVEKLLSELQLTWKNLAYMGDDWNDYPVIKKAHISFAPAQAFPAFQSRVDYVTQRKGGEGAVREAVEYILSRQNRFDEILEKYFEFLTYQGG